MWFFKGALFVALLYGVFSAERAAAQYSAHPVRPQFATPQFAAPQYAEPQYAQPQYAQPQYAQ